MNFPRALLLLLLFLYFSFFFFYFFIYFFSPRTSLPFRVSTGPNMRVNACVAGGGCKRVRGSLTKARLRYRCRFLSTQHRSSGKNKNLSPLYTVPLFFPSCFLLRVFMYLKTSRQCGSRVMRVEYIYVYTHTEQQIMFPD